MKFLDGQKKFFGDKDSDKFKEWQIKLSLAAKKRMANTPFEILSARNRKHRLNMTEEQKFKRKKKIQEVYKTGKHDSLWERYSKERSGIKNPACRIYLWLGKEYTSAEFKALKIPKNEQELNFKNRNDCKIPELENKVYESIICNICGVSSNNKKPSAFKRWHFKNCKGN